MHEHKRVDFFFKYLKKGKVFFEGCGRLYYKKELYEKRQLEFTFLPVWWSISHFGLVCCVTCVIMDCSSPLYMPRLICKNMRCRNVYARLRMLTFYGRWNLSGVFSRYGKREARGWNFIFYRKLFDFFWRVFWKCCSAFAEFGEGVTWKFVE